MQFVWFLGNSAVGKQQTITRCLGNPNWAAVTFNIDISNGLRQFQSGEIPPPDFRGCSLMKWQYVNDGHIQTLHSQRPDDEHIAIFLRRATEEHLRGCREKFLDVFKENPDQVCMLQNDGQARKWFEANRIEDEKKSRSHRGKVDRFMEFFIENGVFTLVQEPSP